MVDDFILILCIMYEFRKTLKKNKRAINNGQSGNIVHKTQKRDKHSKN